MTLLFTNALSRCLPILTEQRHCSAVFVSFTYVFGYLYIKYCIHSSCIFIFELCSLVGNLKTPSFLGIPGMLKQYNQKHFRLKQVIQNNKKLFLYARYYIT